MGTWQLCGIPFTLDLFPFSSFSTIDLTYMISTLLDAKKRKTIPWPGVGSEIMRGGMTRVRSMSVGLQDEERACDAFHYC